VQRALASAEVGVRVIHLGQSAGPAATLQSAWVRGKVADVFGHSLFSVPDEVARNGYRELCEQVRDGKISFELETFPLDKIAAAWECQASGSPGAKVIVSL
jgi:NADPH2:quinone reductase